VAGRSAAITLFLICAGCAADNESARHEYNRALAAMRAGEPRIAAAAAERAAALDGGAIRELAIFLRGNAVFAQCLTAERAAGSAAAEPFAFDVAITYGEAALRYWSQAAMLRGDWPSARRNVERALLKIRELRRKKAEAEEKQRRRSDPTPKPKPQPDPPPVNPDAGKTIEEDPNAKVQASKLSPAEIVKLMDRLAAKEKQKLQLRRSERGKRATGAKTRDW